MRILDWLLGGTEKEDATLMSESEREELKEEIVTQLVLDQERREEVYGRFR